MFIRRYVVPLMCVIAVTAGCSHGSSSHDQRHIPDTHEREQFVSKVKKLGIILDQQQVHRVQDLLCQYNSQNLTMDDRTFLAANLNQMQQWNVQHGMMKNFKILTPTSQELTSFISLSENTLCHG